MGAKIAGLVICLLCAIPFLIIGYFKNSKEPIGLWAEDSKLRTKIHNVKQFNEEMSKLYLCCAMALAITGFVFLIHVIAGVVGICLECTIGIYIFYKKYKAILSKYC